MAPDSAGATGFPDMAMTDQSHAIRGSYSDYARERKHARRVQILSTLLFLAAVLLSAYVGDFFELHRCLAGQRRARLDAGNSGPACRGLANICSKTVPTLRLESLGSDLAEWFWRWKIWLGLLFETILIAYAATVLGVVGGFLLSFLAARNLSPGTARF